MLIANNSWELKVRDEVMGRTQPLKDPTCIQSDCKQSIGGGKEVQFTSFREVWWCDSVRIALLRSEVCLLGIHLRSRCTYSGAKKYLVSHQLCKFSHLKLLQYNISDCYRLLFFPIVLLTVCLFIPCLTVLLFVSHCFALSWPGHSCKWELVLN
jgi:hypothetical protein